MTTVDVTVLRLDGEQWRLEAESGLFGPATELLHAVGELVRSGEAHGSYGLADIDAQCSGAKLAPIVAKLTSVTVNGEKMPGELAAEGVVASGLYSVWGVEF